MKNQFINFIILLFLSTPSLGQDQDLEARLIRLLENNQLADVITNLEIIKKKYPNNPTPHYIEAFIERDARKAAEKYKFFIERFPLSQYVVNAKYRLAQYYFAKGSCFAAGHFLDDIIESHAKSPFVDDAYYLRIRCLITLEQVPKAREEIKHFIKKYSDSPLKELVLSDQQMLDEKESAAKNREPSPKPTNETQKFAIQTGAFQIRENAAKQVETITRLGYKPELVQRRIDGTLLYLVWLGDFETEGQALSFGEVFIKKYGIPFRVINKLSFE